MSALSSSHAEGWVAIVDDDSSIRRSLARVFRVHGIAARTFCSAEEYLSRQPCEEPTCLVVDVNLGGLSGFELKDHLDTAGKTPPIIFITAMDEISSAQLEGRSGSHGYLRKPFDTKALLELVGRHLNGSTQSAAR